jgi:DNA-binding transcriptional LysR family regulator
MPKQGYRDRFRNVEAGQGVVTALSQRLPRLSGLVMFEASARLLSFTRAAEELRVTQAAISQQVRALETELGVALFVRLHRKLQLTPAGLRLHRAAMMGLEHIADVADAVRSSHRAPAIRIGATFAVATFWLVRRLPAFRSRHPDIDIHLIASDRGFEAVADQVDAGIAYGNGTWPGFDATLLHRGAVFPVCSPRYLGRRKLSGVNDLLGETLLSHEDNRAGLLGWSTWFARLNVSGYSGRGGMAFNSHPLLLQAACDGQGVALGWSLLVDDMLADGTLIRPVAAEVESASAFYTPTP